MTSPLWHYRRAQALLNNYAELSPNATDQERTHLLTLAQVHATLATVPEGRP